MRILFSTQHYPPEPGAAQNRVGTFARGLAARGHQVTVVCEQPCHPEGEFQPGFGRRPVQSVADEDGVRVHRLWVSVSPIKTMSRRLAFYASFAAGSAAAVTALGRRNDVVLSSSPPLPGTLTACAAARAIGRPYVADIRDLWPAAAEALGELNNARALALLTRAERRLYRHAAAVTTTTQSFCTHIDELSGEKKSVHLPNGALDALLDLPHTDPPDNGRFVVGYAGNHGLAQGLDVVLDAAEALDDGVVFKLVGDGPLRDDLQRQVNERGLQKRIEMRPGVPTAEVAPFMQAANALLVPLRDHPMFANFMPSKLYDTMAIGRPALVATRGEAQTLVEETGAGLAVPPQDGAALARAVQRLRDDPKEAAAMAAAGRSAAAGLRRSIQVERLETTLQDAIAGRRPT